MEFEKFDINTMKTFSLTLSIALFCLSFIDIHSFSLTKTLYNKLQTVRYKSNNQSLENVVTLSAAKSLSPIKNPATTPPYKMSLPQSVYVFLTTLFVTCLIVADVIGVKIFEIKLPFAILGHTSIEHTCGMLTFPITFLLGDVINEYYGAKATKNTVYLGLFMSVLVFFFMNVAQAMPFLDKPFNGVYCCLY